MLLLGACDTQRVHEAYVDLPQAQWQYDSLVRMRFEVTDPQATYNLYYNLRHNLDYPFYNFYVQYQLLDSAGKPLREGQKEHNLMEPQTGQPLGEVSSHVATSYTHRIPLLQNLHLPYAGAYSLQLRQYMRTDTLKGIESVGIRLEKAQ